MARFQVGFEERPQVLTKDIGAKGNTALARLEDKGLTVVTGLTRYFAGAIGVMARQPHIREFCPKDATSERYESEASTERFLKSKGGLAMFLLLSQVVEDARSFSGRLDGYAWTELAPCKELPDHPIASIYRIGEHATGKGLSRDFVQTVVSATHAHYAPEAGIGLQVWKSNFAVKVYQDVGFEIQPNPDETLKLRPTLDANAENGLVPDTRLFMAYDSSLFDQ